MTDKLPSTAFMRAILNDMFVHPLATDQKTVAERKWRAGRKPAKPQLPADHGLFSDDAAQLDLCEMFMDPTNDL